MRWLLVLVVLAGSLLFLFAPRPQQRLLVKHSSEPVEPDSASEWDDPNSTDADFDAEVAKHEFLLVEFYAPWCGHCKKLTPEYISAAATLAARDPPLYVAKVDATENNALAERFEVKGFPTLIWFVNGQKQEYTGGRTADTIVQWIVKKAGPASEAISCDDLAAKTADNKLNLVYFGEMAGDMFASFMSAAQMNDAFSFFHTAGECAAAHGASANSVSVFRSFDNSPVHYTGAAESAAIAGFMESNSVPILIEFSEDYIDAIFAKGRKALILFSDDAEAANKAQFADAAAKLVGDILFVQSGTKDGIQARLAEFVGVESSAAPALFLLSPGEDMQKFLYSGDVAALTVADVEAFLNEFRAGNLKVHLKSEPIPEEQGATTTLVGYNFEEIVKNSDKDVLVKFYAPWCGHCKKLAPIWDDLAEHVKDIDDLVIAKIDSTANEVAGQAIKGYPTLKFFPKDNKRGVDYDGGRELEDFKDWLATNSAAYKSHHAKNAANDEL